MPNKKLQEQQEVEKVVLNGTGNSAKRNNRDWTMVAPVFVKNQYDTAAGLAGLQALQFTDLYTFFLFNLA